MDSAVLCELAGGFHQCAQLKARGLKSSSKSALIMAAHVLSWPPIGLRHVRDGVARRRSVNHATLRKSRTVAKTVEPSLD